MKLKIFTFQFSDGANGFDDKPLQDFIADKEVIDFSEHFFIHEKIPYLNILISYRLLNHDEKRRDRGQDPRKELDEKEKEAYDALRAWRAARARQEGLPPYMIANNNVGFRLASSRQRPDTMCLRTHRLCQCPDHRPGPVPRCYRGQI